MVIVVGLSDRFVESIVFGFVVCFVLGIIEGEIRCRLFFVCGLFLCLDVSGVLNRLFRLKLYRHFWLDLNLGAEL
jgi:hypothetical protein